MLPFCNLFMERPSNFKNYFKMFLHCNTELLASGLHFETSVTVETVFNSELINKEDLHAILQEKKL